MSQPFMVIGEPPDPDEIRRMQEQARRIEEEDLRITIEARRNVIRWAAVVCTCRQRFGWLGHREQGEPPPQGGCIIHGGYMIHPKTGELL